MSQARKIVFVFNEVSRHEDVGRSGGVPLRIYKLLWNERSPYFHALFALFSKNKHVVRAG